MFLAFTAVMEVVCVQQQPAPPPIELLLSVSHLPLYNCGCFMGSAACLLPPSPSFFTAVIVSALSWIKRMLYY